MLVQVSEGNSRLNNDAERQLKLSQRYAHLQERARYASGTDPLPERELLAVIDGAVGAGTREVKAFDLEGGRMLVNVVDGDYFGIKGFLQQ